MNSTSDVARPDSEGHPSLRVQISRSAECKFDLPTYATALSSGFDLQCMAPVILGPRETVIVDTGFKIAVPPGYELQIRSRSGLAAKSGVIVLNSPGTIDADYRGPLKIILHNTSHNTFEAPLGSKIAQAVLCPVVQAVFSEVKEEELGKTVRGEGGFGSTGL